VTFKQDDLEPILIGFDGSRLSVSQRTGTETYSAQILHHLAPLVGRDTLRVYLRARSLTSDLGEVPGVESIPIPFPRLWTHARLSWEMRRHRPDVLFVPAHVVPAIHPPTVVTIHDLGYLHMPEDHPPAQRKMLDLSTRWSARTTDHIIAISEATRHDLIGAYGVSPNKISVIHHGVGSTFQPRSEEEIADVRARLRLPPRFVLAVGTVQPRKNLGRLAASMRTVAAAGLEHRLVVAGKPGWLVDRVERDIAVSGASHLVDRLGYVSAADLPLLYAAADAFAFPSLYEGFGLPVLEAMAAGTPVLTSDRAALPEVAGNAALLVDPTDSDAIGDALARLLTDQALRAQLRRNGLERSYAFTWERAAAATLSVLRSVARGQTPA
jgi:glycosyltransferase involved in cell wall biosynthesis